MKALQMRPKVIFLAILIILLGAACTRGSKPSATPTVDKTVVITVDADVQKIQIHATDTYPVQASVTVSGELPDSCTQIGKAEQQVGGKTIYLKVSMDRPITAICTEGVVPYEKSFPLDLKGLPAGKYTVNVNDITSSLELPEAPLVSTDASQVCPKATADTVSYVNEQEGFCLLNLPGFTVQSSISNTVVLESPPVGQDGKAVPASLTIEAFPDSGTSSAKDIADERLGGVTGSAEVNPQPFNLGGEPALMADQVPGELATRQVFVVHDGTGYVLTLSPVDSAAPLAYQAAELLWKTVSNSFTFIPRQVAGETCKPNSQFLEDVTIPDGTEVVAGEPFIKTWSLRNSGTCTWDSNYQLVQIDADGNLLTANPRAINLPRTAPGKKAELSVSLTVSPDAPVGSQQRAEFQLHAPNGELFGINVFALVVVKAPDAPNQ
jgi:hypothetical protein